MPIILVRHADAVAEDFDLPDDARYLTEVGRRDAAALARRLADAGPSISAIVASPLARALQTAEILAAALGHTGIVQVIPNLAPRGDLRLVADALRRQPGTTLAVGHEPGLSALASLLLAGATYPSLPRCHALIIDAGHLTGRLAP